MKPNEYLQQSKRTDLGRYGKKEFTLRVGNELEVDLLHASLGMNTEQAEFADVLKKYLAYGKEIDKVNLLEELGDQLWYIAMALRALDSDFETVFTMNINKLQKRFPHKFESEKALNRDLETERQQLEDDAVKERKKYLENANSAIKHIIE